MKEKFDLPFIYDTPDNKEDINGYNFFTYVFNDITWDNPCAWKQTMEIAYVSNEQLDLKEREIWQALRSIGLRVAPEIRYARFYLSDRKVTVDVVIFTCYRGANYMG